ncbi:hypothetical protein M0R04_05010 [Candidatus Dojkabacteria bacterium]|nr:hypothetical protein [Candidatus Dojkabacteria bacterium]
MSLFLNTLIMIFSLTTYCSATNIEIIKVGNYYGVIYQGLEVRYHKDTCGSLSENTLLNIAHDSEAGVFDWNKMRVSKFRHNVLKAECKRLQKEMISRSLMDTILNKEVK